MHSIYRIFNCFSNKNKEKSSTQGRKTSDTQAITDAEEKEKIVAYIKKYGNPPTTDLLDKGDDYVLSYVNSAGRRVFCE